MKFKDGKMNSYSFDESKKNFYERLKNRKDELEEELQKAQEFDFDNFNTWEQANYEYRFLKDTLGPVYYQGLPQWDYNGLLHLPKIKWTDSDGDEHIHALIGTHTPSYYGFLGFNNLVSSDNSIIITRETPNESEDDVINFKVNSEVVGKIDDVKVDGTSVVTDKVANIDLTGKQNNVIYQEDEPESAEEGDLWAFKSEDTEISYNDLINKPEINGVTLQGNVSLSTIDVYDRDTVDKKIASSLGTYRGEFDAGTIAPEWSTYDYDTFIKSKITDPENNNWVRVGWTASQAFDKCIYSTATNTWNFDSRESSSAFTAQYVELYGAKGEVTQDQLDILKANVVNYIWLGESTENDDGLILHCIYYNPENSATYEGVKGDTNYTLTLDLSSKQYTVATTQFAKEDELADYAKTADLATVATTGRYSDLKNKPTIPTEHHLYRHDIIISSGNNSTGAINEDRLYMTLYLETSETFATSAAGGTGTALRFINWYKAQTENEMMCTGWSNNDTATSLGTGIRIASNIFSYGALANTLSVAYTYVPALGPSQGGSSSTWVTANSIIWDNVRQIF